MIHGVEEEDIQTNRFSIDPHYQYTDDGRRRLIGYQRSEAVDTPISVGSDVIRVIVRGVFALR